jgi:hypothetical protein
MDCSGPELSCSLRDSEFPDPTEPRVGNQQGESLLPFQVTGLRYLIERERGSFPTSEQFGRDKATESGNFAYMSSLVADTPPSGTGRQGVQEAAEVVARPPTPSSRHNRHTNTQAMSQPKALQEAYTPLAEDAHRTHALTLSSALLTFTEGKSYCSSSGFRWSWTSTKPI